MRLSAANLVWVGSALVLLIAAAALVLSGNPGPSLDSPPTVRATLSVKDVEKPVEVEKKEADGQSSSPITQEREPAATLVSAGSPSEPSTDNVAPVNPQVSNVTGVAFSVSWVSAQPATGVVHWGLSPDSLNRVSNDARGADAVSETHYVPVTDLKPDTSYYFDVVTGNGVDDNSGQHYTVRTGPLLKIPGMPVILFGHVLGHDRSTQIPGAILTVIVSDTDALGARGSQSISVLAAKDGSWAIELSARTADLQDYYAETTDPRFIHLRVLAGSAGLVTEVIPFADREEALSLYLR